MRNTNHPFRIDTPVVSLLAVGLAASLSLAGCSKAKDETKNQTKNAPPATNTQPAGKSDTPTPPAAGANSLADAAGTFTVDPGHSNVIFRISHFGFSNFYGQFNKFEGSFSLNADPAKSSIELTVDAASVFTANKKRDDHVKSPDFFNVQQFPTITFKSTAIKSLGEKKYEVAGDLTLHGVTKPVTAVIDHIGGGISPADNQTFITGFEGEFTFKRSDFGMNYMQGALGDDIRVIVALEGARQ